MIYLAGPLTHDEDAQANSNLAAYLRESDFNVFLPQEMGRNAQYHGTEPNLKRVGFFKTDVNAMNKCDVCVALIRRECSSGTAFELGYMYAQQKTCLIYNPCQLSLAELGTMLIGSCVIFNLLDDLVDFLRRIYATENR